MIKRHAFILLILLIILLYPLYNLIAYERNLDITGEPSASRDNPIMLAQFGLGDLLNVLTDDGSKQDSDQSQQDDSQNPPREKSRLERRLDLLQGVGTLLSSSKEIDYESERTIGESLALEGFQRYGMPVRDPELQTYVNTVGMAVARNSLRPGIPYRFVVIESDLQNAFSCPGGIIFLSYGLLNTIKTESQLACVLAHEVGHVGHKHALKSIQRARFFQGVGKITATAMKGEKGQQFESMIGDLQTVLFDKGLDQNMEFEADLAGMETAYRTGYDPHGMIEVLEELERIEASSTKQGSWFSTHPPLSQRIAKCRAQLSNYPDSSSLAQLPERYSKYVK
jgi:predicted Zn-dependent protease